MEQDGRRIGRNELVAIAIVSAAVVAIAFMLLFKAPPSPEANPAEAAARREVEQIYQEELAAAKAEALEKEAAREADLGAAEEYLNAIGAIAPATVDDPAPEAVARPELQGVIEVVPERTPAAAAKQSTPADPPPAKDPQTVDVEALADSVKAEGARRKNNN